MLANQIWRSVNPLPRTVSVASAALLISVCAMAPLSSHADASTSSKAPSVAPSAESLRKDKRFTGRPFTFSEVTDLCQVVTRSLQDSVPGKEEPSLKPERLPINGDQECHGEWTYSGNGANYLGMSVTINFREIAGEHLEFAERAVQRHGPSVSECLLFERPDAYKYVSDELIQLTNGTLCGRSTSKASLIAKSYGKFVARGARISVTAQIETVEWTGEPMVIDEAIQARDLIADTLLATIKGT